MKTTIIILISFSVLFLIAQGYISITTKNTEQHNYKLVKDFSSFQIRKYEPALFSSVKLGKKNYKGTSGEGFGILAGYIFGGNEKQEQIAMTAPVQMKEENGLNEMTFVVPYKYDLSNLPDPNNQKVRLHEDDGYYAATIRYGGFNSEKKFNKYKDKLKRKLEKKNFSTNGPFVLLGYNPPFQWIGRRNEVMVKVNY